MTASVFASCLSVAHDWAMHLHRDFEPINAGTNAFQHSNPPHDLNLESVASWVTIAVWPVTECTGTVAAFESFAMGVCFSTPYSTIGTTSAKYTWDSYSDMVFVNFYAGELCTNYVSSQPFLDVDHTDLCISGYMWSISTDVLSTDADGRMVDFYTSYTGCSTHTSSTFLFRIWFSDEYLALVYSDDDLISLVQHDTGVCNYYAFPYNFSAHYSLENFSVNTDYILSITPESTSSAVSAVAIAVPICVGIPLLVLIVFLVKRYVYSPRQTIVPQNDEKYRHSGGGGAQISGGYVGAQNQPQYGGAGGFPNQPQYGGVQNQPQYGQMGGVLNQPQYGQAAGAQNPAVKQAVIPTESSALTTGGGVKLVVGNKVGSTVY